MPLARYIGKDTLCSAGEFGVPFGKTLSGSGQEEFQKSNGTIF
jgi:hypothetical protein